MAPPAGYGCDLAEQVAAVNNHRELTHAAPDLFLIHIGYDPDRELPP